MTDPITPPANELPPLHGSTRWFGKLVRGSGDAWSVCALQGAPRRGPGHSEGEGSLHKWGSIKPQTLPGSSVTQNWQEGIGEEGRPLLVRAPHARGGDPTRWPHPTYPHSPDANTEKVSCWTFGSTI